MARCIQNKNRMGAADVDFVAARNGQESGALHTVMRVCDQNRRCLILDAAKQEDLIGAGVRKNRIVVDEREIGDLRAVCYKAWTGEDVQL